MILEVSAEDLRDIAAAIHAARKREPGEETMARLERRIFSAIQTHQEALELEDQEAQALRNVLLMRAYDQRRTSEGLDYTDLAERIGRGLETTDLPDLALDESRDAGT